MNATKRYEGDQLNQVLTQALGHAPQPEAKTPNGKLGEHYRIAA